VPGPDVFQTSYSDARDLFLRTAAESGGQHAAYTNPNGRGPAGEDLTCDVVCIGNPNAEKVFVSICGTHGIEGYAGSAIFTDALQNDVLADHIDDTKIVLVHAINPWGFAHQSRCTENNADLNRNFIDPDNVPAANENYLRLHNACIPEEWTADAFCRFMDAYNELSESGGVSAVVDALFKGQYVRPDGIQFGGRAPEWSHHTIRSIIREHAQGFKEAVLIDWHTGLGEYATRFFLCLDDPTSESYKRMHGWYGDEFLAHAKAFSGGQVPKYSGVLCNGVAGEFGDTYLYKLIIEFGTKPNEDIFRAFLIDRWIRFEGTKDTRRSDALRREIMDCYCPEDPAWRTAILEQSRDIFRRTLSGLTEG